METSSSGPNCPNGDFFFQTCWRILHSYIVDVVEGFFKGDTVRKTFTHTNFILIPKK